MKNSASTTPSHSVVLVLDPGAGVVPESMNGSAIAATASCVAVGTRSEYDGETTIHLQDENESPPASQPAFDAMLPTPSRIVCVSSVRNEAILQLAVSAELTRVRIWTNDASEPDELTVVVGG